MDADWSILPSDALDIIALKFVFCEDFIRFSAVCKGWNRASSLVKHEWRATLPSLLLSEDTKENPDCLRKIFNLNDNKIYELNLPETFGKMCWGSAYGWVAMVDSKRNVQLFNPITKAQIHFPSLKIIDNYAIPEHPRIDDDFIYLTFFLFKLVVLKVSRNDHYEFIIVVINKSGEKSYNKSLAFARHGDESWTSISVKEPKLEATGRLIYKIVDVVAIRDDIFALYGDGAIVHWNAIEFYNRELLIPIDYSPPFSLDYLYRLEKGEVEKYLVELRGHLILVVRYKEDKPGRCGYPGPFFYRTNAFDVFILNEDKRWEKNEDLGDVALFLGFNYSMSISLGVAQSSQYSGIYFSEDYSGFGVCIEGGRDFGFYDLKKREIQYDKYDDVPRLLHNDMFWPDIWFIPQL